MLALPLSAAPAVPVSEDEVLRGDPSRPRIIDELPAAGYRLVTVMELLTEE